MASRRLGKKELKNSQNKFTANNAVAISKRNKKIF